MSSASAIPVVSKNRLERFRALRAQLDPTGDPADTEPFYVETSHAVSARVAAELALAPASSHLLVGGVGSGKTTELLAIARRVSDIHDVATRYVDVSKLHDIARLRAGDLVVNIAVALAEHSQDEGQDSRSQRAARGIMNAFWGEEAYERDYEGNVRRAREELDEVLQDARGGRPHLAVMLDGLDRITDLDRLERLVEHDVKTLSALGVGVVLVGPLRALYGLGRVLVQRFDSFHYQPWIDVTRNSAGRDFLTGVLKARAPDAFDSRSVTSLVSGSGGVLRDLLSLAQSAMVETYMEGGDRVAPAHVESAVANFGRKHLQGLRPNEFDVLQRVRSHGSFVQTSEEDLALLMTRRVLEYRAGNQPRYAVHPTIEPLLQELARG